jgi:hypothetical protein
MIAIQNLIVEKKRRIPLSFSASDMVEIVSFINTTSVYFGEIDLKREEIAAIENLRVAFVDVLNNGISISYGAWMENDLICGIEKITVSKVRSAQEIGVTTETIAVIGEFIKYFQG